MDSDSQAPALKRKICLLGGFGVGKTSLVHRFVHSEFKDEYLSTIGVRVEKKAVATPAGEVMLIIWDVAGEEQFFQIPETYVKGAHGFVFVADGTRDDTLATLTKIRERFQKAVDGIPEVILLNKADLESDWALPESAERELSEAGRVTCLRTSARDGHNVEEAFTRIAELVAATA